MDSLESVRAAVQSWRVTHPRRGRRFPAELKQRVACLVGSVEVGVLSRELRVSTDQLQRWRASYSPSPEQAAQGVPCSPFIELPLSLGAGQGAVELELEVGGVSRLRLRGELPAATIRGIVEAVCQAQAGGCS